MKTKHVILLLIILSSCMERNKEVNNNLTCINTLNFIDVADKDIMKYYNNRFLYEFIHNAYIINPDQIMLLLNLDSKNLIKTRKENINLLDTNFHSVLNIQTNNKDLLCSYIFYKHQEIQINDKVSSDNILHIEYTLTKNTRKKIKLFSLKEEFPSESFYTAFIKWSSLPTVSKSYIDSMKIIPSFIYTWGINLSTDTIWSNLSYSSVKKLHPDFEGKYIFKKYKEITIDYQHSPNDEEFFYNIKYIE